MLFVFMLATFIGLMAIQRVSRLLHTPLMSLTNAISAIAVVGSIIVRGTRTTAGHITILGLVAYLLLGHEHRQRLPDHRPHAQDVQEARRGGQMSAETLVQLAYLVATGLFILSLRWMSDPETARRGVFAGVGAMALAVAGTLAGVAAGRRHHSITVDPGRLHRGLRRRRYPLAWCPSPRCPSGPPCPTPSAAWRRAWWAPPSISILRRGQPGGLAPYVVIALAAEILLGFLTFTGSLMAAGKLQEVRWIPQRPVTYPGQNCSTWASWSWPWSWAPPWSLDPLAAWGPAAFLVIIGLSLAFGVLFILPIGGADMPTVISILNAYAGLSAVAMGFVLDNKLLITAGALDGVRGLILSIIMCRAMNRSFTNVLFGAFGQAQTGRGRRRATATKAKRSKRGPDARRRRLVVIVPGYGMAVAQAQHRVRELYDALKKRGITVKFAIHPVAGRMPGHMNVLLAEAEIPYDDLVEMDDINPDMPHADVALVIGANDIVNPAARTTRAARSTACRSSRRTRPARCTPSSAARTRASPASTTSCTTDKTFMLFGDAKAWWGTWSRRLAGRFGNALSGVGELRPASIAIYFPAVATRPLRSSRGCRPCSGRTDRAGPGRVGGPGAFPGASPVRVRLLAGSVLRAREFINRKRPSMVRRYDIWPSEIGVRGGHNARRSERGQGVDRVRGPEAGSLAAVFQLHHLNGEFDIDDAAGATFQVQTGPLLEPQPHRSHVAGVAPAKEARTRRAAPIGRVRRAASPVPNTGRASGQRLPLPEMPLAFGEVAGELGKTRRPGRPAPRRTQTRIDFVQPAIRAELVGHLDDPLPQLAEKMLIVRGLGLARRRAWDVMPSAS